MLHHTRDLMVGWLVWMVLTVSGSSGTTMGPLGCVMEPALDGWRSGAECRSALGARKMSTG